MKTYNFDFAVEGLNDRQAGALFDVVLAFVEGFGAEMSGGFTPPKEDLVPFMMQLKSRLDKRQEQPNGKD